MGEIIIFAGKFDVGGSHVCDGRVLSIQDNTDLYSILLNRFGGEGRVDFRLPDLRATQAAMRDQMGLDEKDKDESWKSIRILTAIRGRYPPRERSTDDARSIGLLGEIRLTPLLRAPEGWAFCDGAELAEKDFPELHSLIGTKFGGDDGSGKFALPDLMSVEPEVEFTAPESKAAPKTPLLTKDEVIVKLTAQTVATEAEFIYSFGFSDHRSTRLA